ncbi:MAG: hypothetical protein EXR07_00510 [Acetobacteraceae bacterium]|nr:hypothetical protein [Acetobacteraceae bacterium]
MAKPSPKKLREKTIRLGPYDPDLSGPIKRPFPGQLPRETVKLLRAAVKTVYRQRAKLTGA